MRPMLLFAPVLALALSTAALAASAPGEPAWPSAKAARAELPVRYDDKATVRLLLPPIAQARIDRLRSANGSSRSKRLQIGVERSLAEAGFDPQAADLNWQPQADGGYVARLELGSPAAGALRAALAFRALPAGLELRFSGSDDAAPLVVDAAELLRLRAADALVWSPVTVGDTMTIEFRLPAGVAPTALSFSLPRLAHLVIAPDHGFDRAKIGESDTCEYDAACVSNPSQAYNNAKNAVARMVFQEAGSSYLCTGTLLNDTDTSTQVPYFYSAAHCISSQATANTLTTYWFYDATACGSGALSSSARQVSGGAALLYVSEPDDVLFLRLNGTPPSGAYYLGWNSNALGSSGDMLVLHHPQGDVKKVSLGQITGSEFVDQIEDSNAHGTFTTVGYTDGATEGGSSGSGLLTFNGSEYQLRGGLLGGSSACDNTGSLDNPDNVDDYSLFSKAYASLAQYLAPGTTQPPSSTDYTGAWYNPAQNGWGLVVIRFGSGAYAMYLYHYASDRTPAWYLAAGTLSGSTFSQPLYTFNGPWFGSSFDPSQVTSAQSGTLSVTFSSATTASITFVNDGKTVSTTLTKLDL